MARIQWISLLLALSALGVSSRADDGPVAQWRFTKAHVSGKTVKPLAGGRAATIVGPVKFSDEAPHALILDGKSKSKHRIAVTDNLPGAGLPKQDLTLEAWVCVDRPRRWGGIIGAFQDNGRYEKGWFLGTDASGGKFCFGIATARAGCITYLASRQPLSPGAWYHVAGTYDGKVQRLYVDGKLVSTARKQSGPIAYPPRGFYTIGAYHDDNELYTLEGRIEQVSVYARALGAEELATRFDARKKLFPGIEPVSTEKIADWPTYMHDNRRSGRTDEALRPPLVPQWTYNARRPPRPAWPPPAKQDWFHKKYNLQPLVTFDRALHVVVAGEGVYFGSSSEDKVCRLDARTGRVAWAFHTEGPVRLAPSVADGKVLFGSDDGFVYCVRADDGGLLWKVQAAPEARRIAGNGRIISLWPVRTGVIVDGGRASFGAGLFPLQGVYQYSLDAGTGKVLERTKIDRSVQGYLELRGARLFAPTGRHPKGAWLSVSVRRGKAPPVKQQKVIGEYPFAAIAAGAHRIAGGDGKVAVFSAGGAKPVWSAGVQGKAYSLAVARGRLLVGTDRGIIYCFGAQRGAGKVVRLPRAKAMPAAPQAAKILQRTGIRKGYCLLLGGVELAAGIAGGSELQVVCVMRDARAAAEARRRLDAAALAGRVAVHHCPGPRLPYSDYLFNLVVDAARLAGRAPAISRDEVMRVLRPCGGVAVLGPADGDVVRRGPLDGQGEWTHLYAEPGNTACSGDSLAGGAATVQWFGRPGPRRMVDRHNRGPAPLYKDGRVFVSGLDHIAAVDAYNGTVLWEKDLGDSVRPAAGKSCGNMAVASEALYVAAGDKCHAFDPQTGRELRTFAARAGGDWGYVACVGDVLLGSRTRPGASRWKFSPSSWKIGYSPNQPVVCSEAVFAYDRRNGRRLWTYRPARGVVINPTLAAAGGRVYFVESGNPKSSEAPDGRATLAVLLKPSADLVALDLRTGRAAWRRTIRPQLHHVIFLSAARGVLLLSGSKTIPVGDKKRVRYDLHAFAAETGRPLWNVCHNPNPNVPAGGHGELTQHPAIVGQTVYIYQSAYALPTGRPITNWQWKRGGHGCGTISTSLLGMFNRGGGAQQTDLKTGRQAPLTRVSRPGCWINIIPAGGLVLIPEASSGCTCNFALQTSLALRPVPGEPAPAEQAK